MFGIQEKLIDKALRNGILVLRNGKFEPHFGILSLTYNYVIKKYIFVYGNTAENASYVLLEDINKTWKLK